MKTSTLQTFILASFRQVSDAVERTFLHTDKAVSSLKVDFDKKLQEQAETFAKLMAEQNVKHSGAVSNLKDSVVEQLNELKAKVGGLESSLDDVRQAAAAVMKDFAEGFAKDSAETSAGFAKTIAEFDSKLTQAINSSAGELEKSISDVRNEMSALDSKFEEMYDAAKSLASSAKNEASNAIFAASEAAASAGESRRVATMASEAVSGIRIPEPADLSQFMLKSEASSFPTWDALDGARDRLVKMINDVHHVASLASEAVSGIRMPDPVDLSGYATKADLDALVFKEEFSNLYTKVYAISDSVKALSHSMPLPFNPEPIEEQIKSLQAAVDAWKAPEVDLSGIQERIVELGVVVDSVRQKIADQPEYTTLEVVQGAISGAVKAIPEVDLSPVYAKISELSVSIASVAGREMPNFVLREEFTNELSSAVESIKATIPQLPAPFDPTPLIEKIDGLNSTVCSLRGSVGEALSAAGDEIEKRVTPEEMAKAIAGIRIPEPTVEAKVEVRPIDFLFDESSSKIVAKFAVGDEEKSCEIKVPSFNYEGIWSVAKDYSFGQTVTHEGSLWVAKSDNPGRPGIDTLGWKLIVKGGAKGKDGRNGIDGRSIKSYGAHEEGNVYYKGDFLNLHGRIWQCNCDSTENPPEGAQVTSSQSWVLVGYTL